MGATDPEARLNENRPKVLIVDDDASFGGMVAEVLTDKGYDAVRTTDPEEALRRAADGSFAAAVVDLVMPRMGGLDVANGIRSASPDTQVVILTGHGDLQSAIEGIHHGIFDYLQKQSIQIPRLERSVQQAVERSRLTRENRELVGRLRESNRLLKALHEITTSLTGEPHLDRLLANLVTSAKEVCEAAAGRVVLLERTHAGELVVEMLAGDGGQNLLGARLRPGEGFVSLAADGGHTVVVDRFTEDPRYSRRCDEMPTALPGLLCAPVRHGGVIGALMVAGREGGAFGIDDPELLATLARQAAVAIENALQHERSINFFTHTCDLLVSFLESMDIFYPGHSRGVAALSDMVTRRLGMADPERRSVHFAALLHDIGKIRLDPALLRSEGQFSEESRRIIERHPVLGFELLKPITLWEELLPIIHSHHERWDGKGYPRRLLGEEIPLGARIVAVADAFDAMTRTTPHGPCRAAGQALVEIEAFAGTQFDPRIARLFVAEYRQRGDPRRGGSS